VVDQVDHPGPGGPPRTGWTILALLQSQYIFNYKYTRHPRIFVAMTPAEINKKWKALQERIATDFDSEQPDVKVMLFLIGVQELGQGPRKFSKRQKEELMHIANCKLFSMMGFYELEGLDQDGWPHWKLVQVIPNYTVLEQEMLLKSLIIDYFEEANI